MLLTGAQQMTGKLSLAAPTSTSANILLPSANLDPGTLVNGDLWNNNGILKFRSSGATKTIAFLGDNVATASLIPGADIAGDRYVGITQTPNYFNYLQTTLSYPKYFPTASEDIIGVISIPSRLFGDYIQPNSFKLSTPSGSLTDDGEGNIIDETGDIIGNIFYYHGLITIVSEEAAGYGFVTYGNAIYGGTGGDNEVILNYVTSSNITCSFSSSYKIYETQYKCTIRENEFNFSQNPSLSSGSTSISSSIGYFYTPGQYLTDNVTGSYFSPYITTVGLYDEYQNLLAVAKLAQPLPVSPTTDTTILINLDR
jgi:hypothetical protein